jgi:hypothetical protein
MKHKRMTISTVLAALMLVSLFAVVSSAASVTGQTSGTTVAANLVGQTMAGTGPASTTLWPNGQTDVFAVDTSGTLWNVSGLFGSGPDTWNSLGGVCTASPAAVSWGNQSTSYLRIDVFVRGSDGAVWQKYYNNSVWSGWHSLGGQLASGTGPAVSSWSAGRLDVFAEGTNGVLYHKYWNGATWSGWESLGGSLTASPSATSPNNGVIDVFVRGTDGAVWQKSFNNGWSSWKSLGGKLAPNSGPGVDTDWLFVQGTDGQLWHMLWSENGATWGTLSGAPPEALSTSSPAASRMVNENTIVCVGTTSGNVWYSGAAAGNWDLWSSAGSPL